MRDWEASRVSRTVGWEDWGWSVPGTRCRVGNERMDRRKEYVYMCGAQGDEVGLRVVIFQEVSRY